MRATDSSTRFAHDASSRAATDTMEGDPVLQTTSRFQTDRLDSLATSVLRNLYIAVTGEAPRAVRSYYDDDTLLLLLRFNPALLADPSGEHFEPLIDISFMAMPEMIAEAVHEGTGRTLMPGNLSICPGRGLAVLAFSVLEDDEDGDTDPFAIPVYWSDGAPRRTG